MLNPRSKMPARTGQAKILKENKAKKCKLPEVNFIHPRILALVEYESIISHRRIGLH